MNAHYKPSWFTEDQTSNNGRGVLTHAGVENISQHKYKPGHYTHLDNLLNPYWTKLTELLPTTMAPNVVTSIGGLHCAMAYFVLWYYSPNLDENVPDWVVAFSGLCTIMYYTFDCMDGKQARRTGTSSPLGQLFDHGVDCLCLSAHIASASGYLMIGGSYWYLLTQSSLQIAFFMAQWEEYYTGILPHAAGNYCGVTEVNYGLGLIAIFNSFIDRGAFWQAKLKDIIPLESNVIGHSILSNAGLLDFELRHVAMLLWYGTLLILIVGCLFRVVTDEYVRTNSIRFSAVSKLISPVVVSLSPLLLPEEVLFKETRSISIVTGILLSHLTMKMITFSMAKMTYASIQTEALPLLMTFLWIGTDTNFREAGVSLLLRGLCFWYIFRLSGFISCAIDEICGKLEIKCFRIHAKTK